MPAAEQAARPLQPGIAADVASPSGGDLFELEG